MTTYAHPQVRTLDTLARLLGHAAVEAVPLSDAMTAANPRQWLALVDEGYARVVAEQRAHPHADLLIPPSATWHDGGSIGHRTATGRLTISAVDDGPLNIEVSAGGGRMVAWIAQRLDGGWEAEDDDATLIQCRPDRLSLLADLDERLGGEIVSHLSADALGIPVADAIARARAGYGKYLIVTRHAAAEAYIRATDARFAAAPCVASATPDDVRETIVAGNLPLHLSALAACVVAIEFSGSPPRGAEYTLDDMLAAGAHLTAYRLFNAD